MNLILVEYRIQKPLREWSLRDPISRLFEIYWHISVISIILHIAYFFSFISFFFYLNTITILRIINMEHPLISLPFYDFYFNLVFNSSSLQDGHTFQWMCLDLPMYSPLLISFTFSIPRHPLHHSEFNFIWLKCIAW